MTTTAYSYMSSASQSGSGISWNNVATLAASTSGAASKAGVTGTGSASDTNLITLHTPEYMASLSNGITFNSLSIKFKGYNSSGTGGTAYFYVLQNGNKRSEFTFTDLTNTALRTYAGDKSYWGILGTESTIITQLKNGAIKFVYWVDLPDSVSYSVTLSEFQVQLDYTLPDTTRASILVTMP